MQMKVVTFSNLYPSARQPRHGIFVEQRLLQLHRTGRIDQKVVAPVPWFPGAAQLADRYRVLAGVPATEMRHGIEVHYPRYFHLPKMGMPIAPLLMAMSLRGTMRRLRESFGPYVLDAHFLYPDGVAACLLGEWLQLPVVMTARGSDVMQFGEYRLPRQWIRWAAQRARKIVTVSDALRQNLMQLGVAGESILTLRNGVDLEVFRPVDRDMAREKISTGGPLLLSVGNLIDLKGHDLAILAMPDLPDVKLLIIGEGPAESALRRLAHALGVESRVRFIGHVAQADLANYYSAADALVLASEREGMPNVVLECLACGTPVIASRVGGIPEVISNPVAGRLLESREPAQIVAAFHAVTDVPAQRAAIRAFAESFGWDDVVTGLLELFAAANVTADIASPAA